MFSSPMSHFFRHALISYRDASQATRQKIELSRRLTELERRLAVLMEQNPSHPKVQALLEKVRRVKSLAI